MVELEQGDGALPERVAKKTGLARTELLRRGLWQVASQELDQVTPGTAFDFLVETASHQDVPPDLSARPDHYLLSGGYRQWLRGRNPPPAFQLASACPSRRAAILDDPWPIKRFGLPKPPRRPRVDVYRLLGGPIPGKVPGLIKSRLPQRRP